MVFMEEKKEADQEPNIMHDYSFGRDSIFTTKLIVFLLTVAFLGIGTGYLLSKNNPGSSSTNINTGVIDSESIQKGTVVGSNDTKTFRDTAEGVLEEGGIEDEGQYHLVRPGGKSQYVYLTSSVIDLSKFIKMKVKVWGETQKAQKAGWLMDVGRVEVLEE